MYGVVGAVGVAGCLTAEGLSFGVEGEGGGFGVGRDGASLQLDELPDLVFGECGRGNWGSERV